MQSKKLRNTLKIIKLIKPKSVLVRHEKIKMTPRNEILNELNNLESPLANISTENIYSVPDGYFVNLAEQTLNRIKAFSTTSAKEELEMLSPLLSNGKQNPFFVPVGYFEGLTDKIMDVINADADNKTSTEELELISPLLNSIGKNLPYSLPAGYFENLSPAIDNKKSAKIISFTQHKWFRVAVAASIIGIIAISTLVLVNQKSITPLNNPQAWVKKNVNKKVSPEKLDEFVILTTNEESQNVTTDNEFEKKDEIKDLIKDVSEKELQDFLNDAVALESNEDDVLMN